MIEQMWQVLTTLSEEAQKAALTRCAELGFDVNRGPVSLPESFANLNSARSVLMDAIEHQKLIQLPLTIQTTLHGHLEAISRSLNGLISGTDEVVNLTSAIEQLNIAVWQFGLHNLSGEVLGYHTKLNQLKHQELELSKLREELEKGLAVKSQLEALREQGAGVVTGIAERTAASEEDLKKITDFVARCVEADARVTALLASAQQSESTSTQLLATTKTSNAEVVALEAKIKEFYAAIDEYRTKTNAVVKDAEEAVRTGRTETQSFVATFKDESEMTLAAHKAGTDKIIETLRDLEDRIRVQIGKATGFSLFHSFQTRQEALVRSKRVWAIALGCLVAVSLGLTVFVMETTTNINSAFYLKLSLSLPLIYAITFCTVQYTRERKLEEEYAFKANISISLVPYQEVVAKLVNPANPAELEKYAAFIIESVNKVFTSPTERVFEAPPKQRGLTEKAVKQLVQVLEPFHSCPNWDESG